MPEDKKDITHEPLMTVAEVARFLRKSEAWVYRKSRSGELPTIMVGRSRRFSRTAMSAWVSRHTHSRFHLDSYDL